MDLSVPCIVEGSSELLKDRSRDMLETFTSFMRASARGEDCGTPHLPNELVASRLPYIPLSSGRYRSVLY